MTEQELMLTTVLGCRRVDLYTQPPCLSADQSRLLAGMQQRRRRGEPLQYILGEVEFCGLPVRVDPRVLIPRPETEFLVEAVLRRTSAGGSRRHWDILDVGTGSGCIAVALARTLTMCRITAIDISDDALEVASSNVANNGVPVKVCLRRCSMADYFGEERCDDPLFDVIVSNPPYVATEQVGQLQREIRYWEPRIALDGGRGGLEYLRLIIQLAPLKLKRGGALFLDIGDDQRSEILRLFRQYPYYQVLKIFPDHRGIERVVCAILS
jgi:release factor glutamine methyltransferase